MHDDATGRRGLARHAVTLLAAVAALLAPASARGEGRTVGEVLREITSDPSVEDVQRAALRQAALEPARMLSLLARLRWAGTLPQIELSAGRGFARDEDLDRSFQEMDEMSLATDEDLDFRCTVRWDLDRLVYDPEELRAVRQAADLSRRRRELLLAVTRLYFELALLRAQERLAVESSPAEAVERALRIAELSALLDGLTGGILNAAR